MKLQNRTVILQYVIYKLRAKPLEYIRETKREKPKKKKDRETSKQNKLIDDITQTFIQLPPKFPGTLQEIATEHFLACHWLVEYLVFQYFSISFAVLPGILPAIKDHLKDFITCSCYCLHF